MLTGSAVLGSSSFFWAAFGADVAAGASNLAFAEAAFFARLAMRFFSSPLETISPVSSSSWSFAVWSASASAMIVG